MTTKKTVLTPSVIPRKYHPKGFAIIHEDRDIIVGDKMAGLLTVGALYDRVNTVHFALNQYIRKGNSRSRKNVFVVHRLDRETSGVLVFAKSIQAQTYLKEHWGDTQKFYYAVVHGKLAKKTGTIESFLEEDEDYVVHSSSDQRKGKLARTVYSVFKESPKFSLVRIELLTGRKNQIRVHMADIGHPVVGDDKYGKPGARLALHAHSLTLTHPFSRERMTFEVPIPAYFDTLIS